MADVIVTMGCGDTCPVYPASAISTGSSKTRQDYLVDQVRPIVDEIDRRVQVLLAELLATAT